MHVYMCICNTVYTTIYNIIFTNMYIYTPTYNDKQEYFGENFKKFKRL